MPCRDYNLTHLKKVCVNVLADGIAAGGKPAVMFILRVTMR